MSRHSLPRLPRHLSRETETSKFISSLKLLQVFKNFMPLVLYKFWLFADWLSYGPTRFPLYILTRLFMKALITNQSAQSCFQFLFSLPMTQLTFLNMLQLFISFLCKSQIHLTRRRAHHDKTIFGQRRAKDFRCPTGWWLIHNCEPYLFDEGLHLYTPLPGRPYL